MTQAVEVLQQFWHQFEEAYAEDHWDPLEALYAPNAEYRVYGLPTPTVLVGSAEICRGLQRSVTNFDRHFDQRHHRIVATLPLFDEVVHYFARVEYRKAGYPELYTITRSELMVDKGKIVRNVNYWDSAFIETQQALAWFAKYGPELGLDPSYG